MRNRIVFLVMGFVSPCFICSQEDAQSIYEGNNLYYSGRLSEASGKYARAMKLNPNNKKANFNQGAALYKNAMEIKSGKVSLPPETKMTPDSLSNLIFDEAAQNFALVANSISDKDTLHQAWHNIGNCYLQKKDYPQAVEAYKKALKYDPKDEETRYNLAYALKHMPPEEKKGGGGQNQQQKQDKKEQKQQSQESQMKKDQAEQLLKALMDAERKLQEKRKQKQEDPSKRDVDKDW